MGWHTGLDPNNPEDLATQFSHSLTSWSDQSIGYDWLTQHFDPITREQTGEGVTRLLIIDGHTSHVAFEFLDYCLSHDIIVFCLPSHSTHLLQPLDVGLFSPLQHYYGRAVDDLIRTTHRGIHKGNFFPLLQQAHRLTYTRENIEKGFKECGVVPFNPRVVLSKLQHKPSNLTPLKSNQAITTAKTPRNRFDLRQQLGQAVKDIREAPESQIRAITKSFVVQFTHTAEHAITESDTYQHEASRIRAEYEAHKIAKTDWWVVTNARVITGEEVLRIAAEREEKDRIAAEKKAKQEETAKKKVEAMKKKALLDGKKVQIIATSKRQVRFKETAQQHRERLRVKDSNFVAEVDLTTTPDLEQNLLQLSSKDSAKEFDVSPTPSPSRYSSQLPTRLEPLLMTLRPRR